MIVNEQEPSAGLAAELSGEVIPMDFYRRPTLEVARGLIGHTLSARDVGLVKSGRIVEVEAYLEGDAASHAYRGMSRRNAAMFGPPGHAYVYLIYGLYWCLNVVTAAAGTGEAILVRAVEPLNMPFGESNIITASGPGRLCRYFGITGNDNQQSFFGDRLTITMGKGLTPKVLSTTRIGITQNAHQRWRFIDANSRSLSGTKRLNESAS